MIGNDVVDLRLARVQSDWRRKGFLDKVFQDDEQDDILSTNNSDQMVWLLWSMKEAAYKAHQRIHDLPRRLNWQQQKTFLSSCSPEKAIGIVEIGKSVYQTSSEITKDSIHTSAISDIKFRYCSKVLKASSAAMKEVLLKAVSGMTSEAEKQRLLLKKDMHGMPFISCGNSVISKSFSLSSHGRFSAFAVSLMNCKMAVKHY